MTDEPIMGKNWANTVKNTVNGKPLDVANWTTSVLTVAPGYHRLKNALGLTAGLYIGRKFMNVLVGERPDGQKVNIDDVPLPMRPLYGKFAYNRHSDDPKDRWMKVVDNMAPAMFGAMGAVAGSYQFFEKRYQALENPQYLDEFEEAMSLEESKPWSVISGATSLMGSASGAGLGPVGNYGASLGNRFTLASGRKIALPGLGKFMTNSHSSYPFGPVQLIERMIHYAAGNPDREPRQLDRMAKGILGPWFKDVSEDQVQAFVKVVQGVRDKFLEEGGIPEEAQGKVKEMLRGVLQKEGLEETLNKIGLDPLEATLGDNGFSSAISKLLGKKGKLAEMAGDFAGKYMARQNGNTGAER